MTLTKTSWMLKLMIKKLFRQEIKKKTLHNLGGRIEMGAGGITKLLKGFLKKKPKE